MSKVAQKKTNGTKTKKTNTSAALLPEMDRPGLEWDRVRYVDGAVRGIFRETAALYHAVRTLEAYAMPHDAEQAAIVQRTVARATKALAEVVLVGGDVSEFIREQAGAS